MKKYLKLFTDNCLLRDWTVEIKNRENIKNELKNVFIKCPYIKCEILNIHISNLTNTSISEILVHINNSEKEILKVVDVIEFNEKEEIISIKAYKG